MTLPVDPSCRRACKPETPDSAVQCRGNPTTSVVGGGQPASVPRNDGYHTRRLAVEWLGYATTRIEGADTVVYLDPGRYGVLSGEWTPPSESARGAHPPARDYRAADGDIVFVTHRHHYDPDGIDRVARDDATIVTFEAIDVNGTDRTDVRPADLPYEVRQVGVETEGVVDGVPF